MKKNWLYPLIIFSIVILQTNGCKKDDSTNNGKVPSASLTISTLSKYSAMPASQILITGTGFSTKANLWVRFMDLNGYQMDVPVVQANESQLLVTVPPYINIATEDWEAGTVAVQIIDKRNSGDVISNSIENFDILDMPVSDEKRPGMATLIFLEEQIKYFKQVQQEMAGTELATPEMINAVSTNISNLEALFTNINKVVNTPGDHATFFNYGSINGQEIKIGLKQLVQCDRFILALFAALSDPNLSDSFLPFTNRKSTDFNPCSIEALQAQAGLTSGQNNGETFNSMGCMASSLPNAINTASNVIFGAGAVGLGVVTLVAIGFEVPVAIVIALPTAAIIYATVGTAGMEVVTGAVLENINNNAAVQAIHSGVDRIENMFRGMVVDFIVPESVGAFKNLLDGNNLLGKAFGDSNTGSDCIYQLSATSLQINAAGGSSSVSVTAGTGCTWTANTGYSWITITNGSSGNGNGTVGYTIQANNVNQERTGSIQIAGKSFTVSQEANTEAGPYDGIWTFTMVGTCVNPNAEPSTWPYPETTVDIGILGHNIIGFNDNGTGALNDEGYAAWSFAQFSWSGTFYSSGSGVGSWNYGPDTAGTTASGTWNATRQ